MFGLDLAVDGVLDQFCDWIYGKLISFFGDFFSMINMMGAELFELEWIKGILLFFNYFAWALYGVGLVVAVFDMAIEAQRGKGGFQDVGLNAIKGFFAASLFTIVPVDSYVFCINILPDVILDFMFFVKHSQFSLKNPIAHNSIKKAYPRYSQTACGQEGKGIQTDIYS